MINKINELLRYHYTLGAPLLSWLIAPSWHGVAALCGEVRYCVTVTLCVIYVTFVLGVSNI